MDINYFNRKIIQTEDGSSSLQLTDISEQYHSIYGAINESKYIYIEQGLQYFTNRSTLHILELGLGAGLNVFLTYNYGKNLHIVYQSVEKYPISVEEAKQLNYTDYIDPSLANTFLNIHSSDFNCPQRLSPNFIFTKYNEDIRNFTFPFKQYDLVYYDMFSPNIDQTVWDEDIFLKISQCMSDGGIIITYCAKGSIKRILKSLNFLVESIPGPRGKREITRAIKVAH